MTMLTTTTAMVMFKYAKLEMLAEFFTFGIQIFFVSVSVLSFAVRMLLVSSLICKRVTEDTTILSNYIELLFLNANFSRKPAFSKTENDIFPEFACAFLGLQNQSSHICY